jgi:hypothetical protein
MKNRDISLPTNTDAASVMYSFILIIAFVMILGFVLAGLTQYSTAGTVSQGVYPGTTNPFGMYNYTTIDCDLSDPRAIEYGLVQGYDVSPDDVLDYVPSPTDEDPFKFYDADGDVKYVHVIRNNRDYDPESTDMFKMYLDFISIRREVNDVTFWDDDWMNAAIPFSAIAERYDNNTNASTNKFELGSSQDSLFINTTSGVEEDFLSDFWANDFYLFYGWSLFRLEEVDYWGAIAMVLYQEIPSVHPVINWIFHGFVIGTITFVVFRMAIWLAEAVIPL